MKKICKISAIFLLMAFMLCSADNLIAQKKKKKKKIRKPFIYIPKANIGAPTNREGAASRGPFDLPFMSALVPDHVGISSIDQPTIYWFIRKPTKLKVIFTLRLEPVAGGSIDDLITDEDLDKEDEDEDNEVSKLDGNIGYVFRTNIDCSKKSGIVGISLKKYGVKLLKGRMYSWFVAGRALTKDNKEAGASADKKAQGTIKYLDPTKKEKVVISKAAGMDRIQAYAENGMWYDTLSEFAKLIKKNPKDKELLAFRTGFLTQVGLNNTVRCIQGKDPIVEK